VAKFKSKDGQKLL